MSTKAIPATHKSPNPHDYHNYKLALEDYREAKSLLDSECLIDERQFAILLWQRSGISTAYVTVDGEKFPRCYIGLEPAQEQFNPKILYRFIQDISRKDSGWYKAIGEDAMLSLIDFLSDTETHSFAYNACKGVRACDPKEGKKLQAKAFLQEWQRLNPDKDVKDAPKIDRVMARLGVTQANIGKSLERIQRQRTLLDADPFAPETPEEVEYAERKRKDIPSDTGHLDAFFGEA